MKFCFGVDIGGTSVKMGLFQENGKLIEKWAVKTRTEREGEQILPDVAASIRRKMKEYGLLTIDVRGIGVGIPAPVREDGIVRGTANLGWKYKEVKKELEALTGITVKTGNDANMAALGEMWLGAGRGHENLIMVTLGTGVGGAVIFDGKCVSGGHGAAGEIGHICVNEKETRSCGCGRKGCLEQYASATGIARLAQERLKQERSGSILKENDVNAKRVFDAVKAGDIIAKMIAEEFGRYLGHALANIAAVCDPTIIVIGGGVSKAGKVLLPYIEKPFREKVFFANEATEFALAELANDAGICGAAKLVL